MSQSEVSRIERHPNLLVPTVRAYAVAVGAELEVVVRFGDGERVVLDLSGTGPAAAADQPTG